MYTVNATDAFNCAATNFVNLTFFPQPTVTATSATVCAGQTALLNASGANTYVWQPGNLNGSLVNDTPSATTTYSVIGTDVNGCMGSSNTVINVNPLPTPVISGNLVMCDGENTTLTTTIKDPLT